MVFNRRWNTSIGCKYSLGLSYVEINDDLNENIKKIFLDKQRFIDCWCLIVTVSFIALNTTYNNDKLWKR